MTWVVPSHTLPHRVLEYMERIAILNLQGVFQQAAEKELSDAWPLNRLR
jgi:hypothetical protein